MLRTNKQKGDVNVWDTIVDDIVKDGKKISDITEVEIEEIDDFSEEEEEKCRISHDDIGLGSNEDTITRRNMVLVEQEVDEEKNRDEGWSNPVLSNNNELNEEVLNYQSILEKLEDCSPDEERDLEYELDLSFRRIAGYYSNYEYRWYNKMGHLFDEPAEFYDFFYDLLRDCIERFNPKTKSKKHDRDFRKAKRGVYFNQYFFGALSKRKITNIKKTMNTAKNPSITCQVCGDDVARITEYHLRHQYDESRIRKDFQVSPESINGKRIYDKCPICGEKNVRTSHMKEHNYAEVMNVREYMDRYPTASLAGMVRSLQEPVTTSDDGDALTYEDVYQRTEHDENDPVEMELFSSHIDNVLRDDPFTAEVLKLKMMDYKDREIAAELGETFVFDVEYEISSKMRKKSEIYEYVQTYMEHEDFFKKYQSKFHILSRKKQDNREVFEVSSCAPSKVSSAIKKLRKNKRKIKELFGDFRVPNV